MGIRGGRTTEALLLSFHFIPQKFLLSVTTDVYSNSLYCMNNFMPSHGVKCFNYLLLFSCYLPVTMAKGIGNGFPLAAVVTTTEVAATMGKALHFNTYGGNPMACAVGSSVMDVSLIGVSESIETIDVSLSY